MSNNTIYLDVDPRRRFEDVAAEIFEPVQRYLRRRAVREDADDVFADTLLVIWRRIADVPDEPIPWCIAVARNTLSNHQRSQVRRARLKDRAAAQPPEARDDDPQQLIEDSHPELERALSRLTESETEIVRLWAWDRLEPREIAVVLELTPNAVSVALSRAKRKLAAELEDGNDKERAHNADRIAAPMDIPQVETPPTQNPATEGGDQ